MSMKKNTKLKFKKLLFAIAAANAVAVADVYAGEQFTVSEPSETTLNDKVQASSEFLTMITVAPVEDMMGQALTLEIDDMIGGRVDTDAEERSGTELGGPNGSEWKVTQTNYDAFMKYNTMDIWARYDDFYSRYMSALNRAIALTRIKIGWHGTSIATTTDKAANPLGQDVNKGWFQILREQAPEKMIAEGNYEGSTKVFIGKNTNNPDYQTLDAAVFSLLNEIPEENRTGNEVAIVGRNLISADLNKIYNDHSQTPTEKAMGITIMAKSYAGLKTVMVPGFPDNGLAVTDPKNLHLYYQEGRTRRTTKNKPERNRVIEFISSNDGYAIGDMDAICAFEPTSITLVDETTAESVFGVA